MSPSTESEDSERAGPPEAKSPSWWKRIAVGALVVLLGVVVYTWMVREQIARDLISEQLEEYGIPATYVVAGISPDRQILTDIVIGDPERPDLTIERAEVLLSYGFGSAEIGQIKLIKPRLFGSYINGQLSFGALDRVLFAESDEPAGLPDWDISLDDGRGRLDTDFGPVGIKIEGQGRINDGFAGIVAAIAPAVSAGGCSVEKATLYGAITTSDGEISLSGPTRAAAVDCTTSDFAADDLNAEIELTLDKDFAGLDADAVLQTGAIAMAGSGANSLSGPVKLSFREGRFDSDYDLVAAGLNSGALGLAELTVDGSLRSSDLFENVQIEAGLAGADVRTGADFAAITADLREGVQGTLADPLVAKMAAALDRKLAGASFDAAITGRMNGNALSIVIPQADVKDGAGDSLATVTRFLYRKNGSSPGRLSGNFRAGGTDLPSLGGRMEQSGNGQSVFRLQMAKYSAGESSLQIPELLVTQSPAGAFGFAGSAKATGQLPGGFARNLSVPINGSYSPSGDLVLWRSCTTMAFDSLALANLELSGQRVTLCPARGGAIVRYGSTGLDVAAGAAALNVRGTMAGTPIAIDSGPVGFAYPGTATARQLNITLGPAAEANSFAISDLQANLGEGITGSFSGADIRLFAVPLNLNGSAGEWSYEDGIFRIGSAEFTLEDRAEEPRFNPMAARDATLVLEDNVISANALLRNPASDRAISGVAIQHNLSSGTGFADLNVERLEFDENLQPDELTRLALGVVANAKGIVTGSGRIDWNPEAVTSSGAFSSDALDFAAAFGPVVGASGTVQFVDLLNLTTAPDQSVRVASVNPGIEVNDGVIGFSLTDGQFLGVTGGTWPFMGGTLTLRPLDLNLGVAERRRYVLEVEALEAALFVENLELGNLAATGTFDGELPLVFDEEGFGQIQGGLLVSRAPGGNISYVGELTYEDLSPMANYAFNTLRSLDYERMQIAMDGPLTGEILTKIRFDGVGQGEGTKQNFITRQIANLPIRFNVNIRAPFYKLVTTLKSIYDPSTVRDPREVGLLSDDGTRFVPSVPETPSAPELPPTQIAPEADLVRPGEPSIQTLYSEEKP